MKILNGIVLLIGLATSGIATSTMNPALANTSLDSSWSELLGTGAGAMSYRAKDLVGFPLIVGVQWNHFADTGITFQTSYSPIVLSSWNFGTAAMWHGVHGNLNYSAGDWKLGGGVHGLFRPSEVFPTLELSWNILTLRLAMKNDQKWYGFLQLMWVWSVEPAPTSLADGSLR